MSSVVIKKGSVLVYRIFDISEEVNIQKVEAILKDFRGPDTFKVPKFIDRGIIMKSRPISFGLGGVELDLDCGKFHADVLAKVRDYGVVSLVYQISLPANTTWDDLLKLAVDVEEGSEIDQVAISHCKNLVEQIKPALKTPNTWESFEDYIIYFLEEFEGDTSAKNILARADVSSLLLAEEKIQIASETRMSILENRYQYSDEDLALIEWNSALVIEPKGGRDVPDILEFAVTQLLEMRFYDDLLDNRLKILYDNIEKKKSSIFGGRYNDIYQESSSRYIEFSEFIERVENSLKVVGDFYLAILYRAATRRFRIADWQKNITRKMGLLAQVSSLLQGEVNIRRSHWMEITIIVLIAIELASALLKINGKC